MLRSFATIAFISLFLHGNSQKISVNDFSPAFGKWQGSLTYRDYKTGNPFSMPANLTINPDVSNSYQLILVHEYPNEPKANGNDTLLFSPDGLHMDGETLISKTIKEKGQLEVVTEKAGNDGNENKKALIRHVYIISSDIFIIRKEVKFEGTAEYIMRNEYSMTR